MYIDKLDQIISKNALVSGKQRFFLKDSGSVNEEEVADFSKDIIHCQGNVGEDSIRPFQAAPLDSFIVNHRTQKISEMKEVAGSNDFNRGEGGGGITAASAIMALQEAGNKLSRDMIGDSYGVYVQLMYMCVELMRQFYDEERKFRIENTKGEAKYIGYSNKNLKDQQLPPEYEGEGLIDHPEQPGVKVPSVIDANDPTMTTKIPDPNFEPKFRKPVFDIKIKPEKASPFSRVAHNELAKELFTSGFFDPQKAPQSLIALEMMSFEGKDKIVQMVSKNGAIAIQMQQLQQQMQQMQKQFSIQSNSTSQIIKTMNEALKKATGQDFMGNMDNARAYMNAMQGQPEQQPEGEPPQEGMMQNG